MSIRDLLKKRVDSGDFDSERGGNFLKLETGRNIVRVFPPEDPETEAFFKEVKSHFGIGVCPKTESTKVPCPACQRVKELKEEGDEETANEKRAKKRFIMRAAKIIDGKMGPLQIWDVGSKIAEQVIGMYTDDEFGEFWGDKKGIRGVAYDLNVIKSGKGLQTNYQVRATKTFAELPTPKAYLTAFDEFEAATTPLTQAEMEAALDGSEFSAREVPVKKAKAKPVEDLVVNDEDDLEVPAPKAKAKKKAPVVEDEDDLPAPKAKAKKKALVVEDDEDDLPAPKAKGGFVDDDLEDDEFEALPPPKAKKKAAVVVEDDEDDEDELPPPKAKKKAPVVVEDDDDDEEPAPPKAKKKAPVVEDDDFEDL